MGLRVSNLLARAIRAPGLIPFVCDARSVCMCFELTRDASGSGSMEELMTWLRQRLRTSRVLPFRMIPKSDNLLEVRFHSGFE